MTAPRVEPPVFGEDDRPLPVTPHAQTYLHRHSVKPGHLDAWRPLLPRVVALWSRHGVTTHRLFLETQAEPKLTWLYECDDRDQVAQAAADPECAELDQLLAPHVFRNVTVRPVAVERLTHASPASVEGRIAIMRRYAITGSWDEFLAIWGEIVAVREQYGFRCLFAVADRPKDMFTWAFDFAGAWEDFPAAQRPYYQDPRRVALRHVFDYMADYAITPAEQILLN
jgi:L-rhamnose mutarotase